jgi:hypothetical protein
MAARLRLLLASLAVFICVGPARAAAETTALGDWRFDELEGQAALDGGPHALDGRLGDTSAPDAADPARIPGLSGGALRFNGGSSVRLPDATELAPATLTIEAVVRAPSSPGTYRYIVSRGSQDCLAGAYGVYTARAGGIAIYVFDGSRYVVSATARPEDVWNGAWHHVAGTFDGRSVRLYVDGRRVGDVLDTPLQIDYAGTTMSAAFGRYVGDCVLGYQGDLDLVRMWSGAASAEAVAAAAAAALQPGGAPPPPTEEPLPAATPPEILPTEVPPPAATPPQILPQGTPPPAGTPPNPPGAPARSCAVRVSHKRIAAGRRTTLRARVTLRGKPARAVRVVAKRRGKRITTARTNARGRAHLKLRAQRPGRLRVDAARRSGCTPRYVRVARRGRP